MVMFKMHNSILSVRYSCVCNVLCLWRILLIPTWSTDSMIVKARMKDNSCKTKNTSMGEVMVKALKLDVIIKINSSNIHA